MNRIILHSDLNSFYASVECLYRPNLRDQPIAVAGDPDLRHGIILTANRIAKAQGVKTGAAIWQARQRCPQLVVLPPDYNKYLRFSKMARDIYLEYTNLVEPFGIDEAWLDVTGSQQLFGSGESIANLIRARMKYELGIACSVGVSYNKIFAKLGSDYQKPDATTVITQSNYRDIVWPLPAKDLLYVGPATNRKLRDKGIETIGQLAQSSPEMLRLRLGKWGDLLWRFANGLDVSPVCAYGDEAVIKSIGNSMTSPRDLDNDDDVRMLLFVLSDSVAERMRDHGFRGALISVTVRDCDLLHVSWQKPLERPTCITREIALAALSLFRQQYSWRKPIRSMGVSVSQLMGEKDPIQMDIFCDLDQREDQERLEHTIDWLRRRYGHQAVRRGVVVADRDFSAMNPKGGNTIHPIGYFNGGV